jgi:hypothetical protein
MVEESCASVSGALLTISAVADATCIEQWYFKRNTKCLFHLKRPPETPETTA